MVWGQSVKQILKNNTISIFANINEMWSNDRDHFFMYMHSHKYYFQFLARLILTLFVFNTISPTLQFAFADSTQYYVDATSGNDGNDWLTPATAWQTLAQVNSTPLLQWDTVNLLCSDTWAESLNLNALPWSAILPILLPVMVVACPIQLL